jgi:NitT/TauT family transport system substrate-binding protein/putative hydroxymethylpyrimidine transport system substrate-binding protein
VKLRLAPLCAVLVLLAGCGGGSDAPHDVTLALDFVPNPVHAPIYAAVRKGEDRKQGIRLRIRPPGRGPDSLRLVVSGRATLGVLDIHDLALARERGEDVVGVGALVQRPLGALLAQPDVRRPRDLAGRAVGVSGLPSDPAFVGAIVRHDGGEPKRIRQVTIGFKAVSALLTRRVAAVPAFWNAEGVALQQKGKRIRQFRVERYGAPPYPEVVLFTSRKTLREHEDDVRAALGAVAAGIRDVDADPAAAVRQMAEVAGTPDRALVRAQLDAVRPLFSPPIRLDRAVLEHWASWDARVGLVGRRPDVGRAFDVSLYRAQ